MMTYITPTSYWETFQELGREKLRSAGIKFELLLASDRLLVKLNKNGENYLLFFSTHHLDFSDGVMVCRSNDGKIHFDQRVLPAEGTNDRYGYSTAEIERLISDLVDRL
ncbi:hypothetical protein ACVW0P_002275 [Mucilaginibacter sp. UYNi724]